MYLSNHAQFPKLVFKNQSVPSELTISEHPSPRAGVKHVRFVRLPKHDQGPAPEARMLHRRAWVSSMPISVYGEQRGKSPRASRREVFRTADVQLYCHSKLLQRRTLPVVISKPHRIYEEDATGPQWIRKSLHRVQVSDVRDSV